MCVFLINMHPRQHVEHGEYIFLPFVGWVLGSRGTTMEPSEQGGHCGLSCERCSPSPSGFTSWRPYPSALECDHRSGFLWLTECDSHPKNVIMARGQCGKPTVGLGSRSILPLSETWKETLKVPDLGNDMDHPCLQEVAVTASHPIRSHHETPVWIFPLTLGPLLGLLGSKDAGRGLGCCLAAVWMYPSEEAGIGCSLLNFSGSRSKR